MAKIVLNRIGKPIKLFTCWRVSCNYLICVDAFAVYSVLMLDCFGFFSVVVAVVVVM